MKILLNYCVLVVIKSCLASFHNKCTGMSKKELLHYRKEGAWICSTCTMPQFSESFFSEDDLSPLNDCDLNPTGENAVNSNDSIDWFLRNVKGCY